MLIYHIPLVKDQEITGAIDPIISIPGTDVDMVFLSPEDMNSNLKTNTSWHLEQYGFPLPSSDISNYHLHYKAWEAFNSRREEWCLIVDASVKLEATAVEISEVIQSTEETWDVFFPFDRMAIQKEVDKSILEQAGAMININQKERKDPLPYLLGIPWGNSIYFLSKKGCTKLLEVTNVRQRVDDEILQLSIDERISVCYQDVAWFHYRQQPVVKSVDRNKAIYEAITKNSRWTSQSKSKVMYLLKTISDIAFKRNISLILQGGTHLGYIRHGGIMPWDDDVDLGINEAELASFFEEIDNMPGFSYMEKIEERTGIPFFKVWLDDGEVINGHAYTFPFVDIWPFNIVGNDLIFWNGIVSPGSAQFPYQDVKFEDAIFKIVGNSIEVLDSRYRTWKKGIRVYNYHHRQERITGFPLRVEIQIDETGRMISL